MQGNGWEGHKRQVTKAAHLNWLAQMPSEREVGGVPLPPERLLICEDNRDCQALLLSLCAVPLLEVPITSPSPAPH